MTINHKNIKFAPQQTAASDDIRRMADGVDFVGWRGPDRISHGGFAAEYADMSLLFKKYLRRAAFDSPDGRNDYPKQPTINEKTNL